MSTEDPFPVNSTSDEDLTLKVQHHFQGPGKCIKFNQSDPFHIGDKYGGIPLNLLTNTIGWTTLMVSRVYRKKYKIKC